MIIHERYKLINIFHRRRKEYIVLIACFFVYFVYSYFSPLGLYINETMGDYKKILLITIQVAMCYVISVVYNAPENKYTYDFLCNTLIFFIGINAIYSAKAILSGELVVRQTINVYQTLNLSEDILTTYGLGGLGNYSVHVFLIPLLIYNVIENKGMRRVPYLVLTTIFIVVSLLSSLSAVVLILITMLIFYSYRIFSQSKVLKHKITFAGIVIVFLFILISLKDLRDVQYAMGKIYLLVDPTYIGQVEGQTIDKRYMLYNRSFETFLSNPVFGIGLLSPSEEFHTKYAIGGHSGILDAFAMYGLLFSLFPLFIVFVIRQLIAIRKHSCKKQWAESFLMSIYCYIMFILVDPLIFNATLTGAFLFFIVGPTYSRYKEIFFTANRYQPGIFRK
jgi:hypothetical protein